MDAYGYHGVAAILCHQALNLQRGCGTVDAALTREVLYQHIAAGRHGFDVNQPVGLIHGVDFEEIGDVSGAVARECFRRGLVIERSGRNDCVLKLMPALTITEEELAEGLEIIRESMKTILGGNKA